MGYLERLEGDRKAVWPASRINSALAMDGQLDSNLKATFSTKESMLRKLYFRESVVPSTVNIMS